MSSEQKSERGQTMPCIKVNPAPDASIIPNLAEIRCEKCALATPAMIPDPDVVWETGMRAKPKVPGCRCHAQRPSANGLPAMPPDSFCVFFTDPESSHQPLRHLISERSAER